jgi:hypothetical protein
MFYGENFAQKVHKICHSGAILIYNIVNFVIEYKIELY